MKKKKKIKGVFKRTLAFVICGCIGLAGIAAYFTDADTITNTFTVGQVSVKLEEPNWDGNSIGDAKDMTPGQEIAKDPQIKNDGKNDEFVFMTVAIPYANIRTAAQDGTVGGTTNTQLFSMLNSNNEFGINDGWYQMGYLGEDGVVYTVPVYRDDGTVVSLFAYGTDVELTALTADQTTVPVFNKVRFANVVEEQGLEGTTLDIVVNAYGIQATNIGDTVGNGNSDGKTSPIHVWAVLYNIVAATRPAANDGKIEYGVNDPDLNIIKDTTPVNGTVVTNGDYTYTYRDYNYGWEVSVDDKTKTTYGPILESIDSVPVVSLSNTFAGCANLIKAPIIPESVTIVDSLFENCTSLTDISNVRFSSEVEYMYHTFAGCSSLVDLGSFEFPNNIVLLEGTFYGCEMLTKVPVIPASISVLDYAFVGCISLTGTVTINGNPASCFGCFEGVDFEAQNLTLTGSSTMLDAIGATGVNYGK